MTAILPERVPMRVRGTMSGLAGTSGLVGTFIGVAVAGLTASPIVGDGIVAAQLLVVGTVFAFCTRDVEVSHVRRPARESLRVPHPRQHPNFWWAFVGRFLTFFAYFIVNGMLLFILRHYIHVGDGSTEAASTAIVQVSGVSTLFIMVASLLGGVLADKLGRLKLFVVTSSLHETGSSSRPELRALLRGPPPDQCARIGIRHWAAKHGRWRLAEALLGE